MEQLKYGRKITGDMEKDPLASGAIFRIKDPSVLRSPFPRHLNQIEQVRHDSNPVNHFQGPIRPRPSYNSFMPQPIVPPHYQNTPYPVYSGPHNSPYQTAPPMPHHSFYPPTFGSFRPPVVPLPAHLEESRRFVHSPSPVEMPAQIESPVFVKWQSPIHTESKLEQTPPKGDVPKKSSSQETSMNKAFLNGKKKEIQDLLAHISNSPSNADSDIKDEVTFELMKQKEILLAKDDKSKEAIADKSVKVFSWFISKCANDPKVNVF